MAGAGQGGTVPQVPNHWGAESLRGRRMIEEAAKKSQKYHNYFLQYSTKHLSLEHGGAKLASCPRRHLTSLRSWSMGVRRNFSRGGNAEILLILFRLLTMQCKWTFTKRFTRSAPLVCAGWTSILNLLSELFSALPLSEMLFLFINCLISIFEHFLQLSHNIRIINRQKNMSGEKAKKLDTLVKLFQAMRSRTIWQGCRTTYWS